MLGHQDRAVPPHMLHLHLAEMQDFQDISKQHRSASNAVIVRMCGQILRALYAVRAKLVYDGDADVFLPSSAQEKSGRAYETQFRSETPMRKDRRNF